MQDVFLIFKIFRWFFRTAEQRHEDTVQYLHPTCRRASLSWIWPLLAPFLVPTTGWASPSCLYLGLFSYSWVFKAHNVTTESEKSQKKQLKGNIKDINVRILSRFIRTSVAATPDQTKQQQAAESCTDLGFIDISVKETFSSLTWKNSQTRREASVSDPSLWNELPTISGEPGWYSRPRSRLYSARLHLSHLIRILFAAHHLSALSWVTPTSLFSSDGTWNKN